MIRALHGDHPAVQEGHAEPEWGLWIGRLGAQVRGVRTFLGLSQSELARLAGVSQGTLSRLERGHGAATPLVVIVKVRLALASLLRGFDPAILSDSTAHLVDVAGMGAEGVAEGSADVDPTLRETICAFEALPPSARSVFVAIVRDAAAALARAG